MTAAVGAELAATRTWAPGPRATRYLQRAVVWSALLLLWELAARRVGPFFLPSLVDVVIGFRSVLVEGFALTLLGSLRQMLIGYGVAVVVGIPLGILIGSSRLAELTLGFYVNALFVTSLTALLPFLILVFGFELGFRVAVVFLFCFFYLVINPAAGVRAIPRSVKEMATSFGIGRLRRFFSVTLPATLPYIASGMKLAIGQAVQAMIIAELWIRRDTGAALAGLADSRELGTFFALTICVVLVAAIATALLSWVQRRLAGFGMTSAEVDR